MVRFSKESSVNRFCRPFLGGRNPSKINRSDGNPEFTSAGINAVAPGRDSTSIWDSIQALTNRKPGSEIPGVPASVINAMDIPDFNL